MAHIRAFIGYYIVSALFLAFLTETVEQNEAQWSRNILYVCTLFYKHKGM
jgi:hypothetical protein